MAEKDRRTNNNRFSRITDIIDIQRLERETRKLFWLGIVVAVLFHMAVGSFITYRRTQVTEVKYIPLRFIVVRPPLAKPLRISPKRFSKKSLHRLLKDFTVPSKGIDTKSFETPGIPEDRLYVESEYDTKNREVSEILPDSLYNDGIFDASGDIIPLKNRFFTDSGQYKAEIIVSPTDKKAIQGYAHIAYVWGERYDPPDTLKLPVHYLADALNRYTNIDAKPVVAKVSKKQVPYYPVMYMSTDNLVKLENPARFLRSAGFFIIDNSAENKIQTKKHREKMMLVLNEMYNPYLKISPIPHSHTIYHCFFDFNDGPPEGAVPVDSPAVEGIYIGRELIGVYCSHGYGVLWEDKANEQQLKLGVNLAVYALAPGEWYGDDLRLSFNDTAKNEYTEWYENGRIRFRASEFGKTDVHKTQFGQLELSSLWLPDRPLASNRIVYYTINYPSGKEKYDPQCMKNTYLFNYNNHFKALLMNVVLEEINVGVDPFEGLTRIYWGLYNVYEGWHDNGRKMYYYNYNDRTYAEWDDWGILLDSEYGPAVSNDPSLANSDLNK